MHRQDGGLNPVVSRFWRRLNDEHKRELDRYGLHSVKRVQALRYFTWRWSGKRLFGNDGRYLLTRTNPFDWMRASMAPIDLDDDAWTPVAWSHVDRWAYAVATRLLWQVALKEGDRAVLALPEPTLGDPFPVQWRGRLISQDLGNTSLEIRSMDEALGGRQPSHVVEVGAGYGRTAYGILGRYPDAAYTVVDIHPAIDISKWYLERLFPHRNLTFIDAEAGVPDLPKFDLAISISSLHEMTPELVNGYLHAFDRAANPEAIVYIKQWVDWWNPDDRIATSMRNYRLPDTWNRLFERRAKVQRKFGEAAWQAPRE